MRNDAETSDAAWLLQFYQSFPDPSPVDLLEEALVALAATVLFISPLFFLCLFFTAFSQATQGDFFSQ